MATYERPSTFETSSLRDIRLLENRPFTFGTFRLTDEQLEFAITTESKKRDDAMDQLLDSTFVSNEEAHLFVNFIKHQATANVAPQVNEDSIARKMEFYQRYEKGIVGYLIGSLMNHSIEHSNDYVEFVRPLPDLARSALLVASLEEGDAILHKLKDSNVSLRSRNVVQEADTGIVEPISGPITAYKLAA
jgi:hypothetical protein